MKIKEFLKQDQVLDKGEPFSNLKMMNAYQTQGQLRMSHNSFRKTLEDESCNMDLDHNTQSQGIISPNNFTSNELRARLMSAKSGGFGNKFGHQLIDLKKQTQMDHMKKLGLSNSKITNRKSMNY